MNIFSKNNKIKYISRIIILLYILSAVLCLFSCTQKNDGQGTTNMEGDKEIVYLLEKGVKIPSSEYGSSIFTCGYRSEKETFNVNNVTLMLLFGGNYDKDISKELKNHSYSNFFISLTNEKGHSITLKTVYEELVSEKYRTTWSYSFEEDYGIVDYGYSESIIIPKQLFVSEKGSILISIGHEYMYITETVVYYAMSGDTITLSSKEIK